MPGAPGGAAAGAGAGGGGERSGAGPGPEVAGGSRGGAAPPGGAPRHSSPAGEGGVGAGKAALFPGKTRKKAQTDTVSASFGLSLSSSNWFHLPEKQYKGMMACITGVGGIFLREVLLFLLALVKRQNISIKYKPPHSR